MTVSLDTSGKSALITGAAQGIGFAIAKELAVAGARVAVADLDAEKATAAAQAISDETGSGHVGVAMNVADAASIETGLAVVRDAVGAPDILVNNAGIYRSTPLLDLDPGTWQLLIDVMLTGPVLLAKATVPHMIENRWGRIINMGSLTSVMGYGEDIAYGTAKSGVLGMTRSMAAELAKHQICVNTICPGNVLTQLMRETGAAIEKRDGLEPGQFLRERNASIPLGRLGEPVDIANLVVFLVSDRADYITGQTIHVNGGMYQS